MFTHDLGVGSFTVVTAPDDLFPEQHANHQAGHNGHHFANDNGPALALEQYVLMGRIQLQHLGGRRMFLLVLFLQEPGKLHGRPLLAVGTLGRGTAGFSSGIALGRTGFWCSSLYTDSTRPMAPSVMIRDVPP